MAEEVKEEKVEEVKAEAKTETKKAAAKKPAAKKTAAKNAPAKKAEAKAETKKEEAAPAKKEEKAPEFKEFKYRAATAFDYDILRGPYVTEKTQILSQKENKLVLRVAPNATASQVKSAVQAVFNVKVDKVNIINVLPRQKKSYRHPGQVSGFKKAIVKVNKDYDLGKIAAAAQAEAAK